MIKLLGSFAFLVFLYLLMVLDPGNVGARTLENHQLLAERIGEYGILAVGAGLLIIIGGIDLSMGSTVALASVALALMLVRPWPAWFDLPTWLGVSPAWLAIPLVLLLGVVIGLFHGMMVTAVRIQAFVVTLCGLFLYRGAARWLANDSNLGLGTRYPELRAFFNGEVLGVPVHFLILLAILAAAGLFLHFSVYGRYFYAIGSNEKAAEYCGIPTTRYKVLAFALCSTLSAVFAVLLFFKTNSVQPSSTGSFLELYGIAAAVIGGCSLRGGEGTVLGMLLGTCIIFILPTYVVFKGFPSSLDYVILGGALLLGAVADELLRRYYYRYKKA